MAERRREVALRLALGATPAGVQRDFLRLSGRLVRAGTRLASLARRRAVCTRRAPAGMGDPWTLESVAGVIVAGVTLLGAGCASPTAPAPVLSCPSLTLITQPTGRCSFVVVGASNAAAQWASSDASIVTVSASGLLTGVSAGSATISAAVGTRAATQVVVVALPAPPVARVFVESDAAQIVDVTNTLFDFAQTSPNPTAFGMFYAYHISYGDGAEDSVPAFVGDFVHLYHSTGTFVATVSVTSPFGQTSTATVSALVKSVSGAWSTGEVVVPCATPVSGVRTLRLTQAGTVLTGTYVGPSGRVLPVTGLLAGAQPGPGRYVTLTAGDGMTLTSNTANAGVSPDASSIGLYSSEPCLQNVMLVFGRQ